MVDAQVVNRRKTCALTGRLGFAAVSSDVVI